MPKVPRAPSKRAAATTSPKSAARTKNPKDSHLFTDDNPSTTLHGTGFSSAQKARDTIALVSRRSTTYQFQTVNTMFHRAKHHPHPRDGMREAMDVFREWLDVTYPALKESLEVERWKKGMLGKSCVQRWMPVLRSVLSCNEDGEKELRFAEVYVKLGKAKRLGNVLLDDSQPGGLDWERTRQERLHELVGRKEKWDEDELWKDEGGHPTETHAKLIAWAWSPVPDASLLKRLLRVPTEIRQAESND